MDANTEKEKFNLGFEKGDYASFNRYMGAVLDLLREKRTVTITLTGFSMRPFLEDKRDKGVLKLPGKIRPGMPVMAFVDRKRYILHRVIRVKDDIVTLMGDGNLGTEQCRISDIVAEVEGFYRKGRTKMDYVSGWKWRVYSFIWMKLTPFRRYLLFIYRRLWIPILGPM